jgi:hypothetical protein
MFIIDYLRQFKIAGYAIFDFTLAFVGMYFIAPLLTKLFRKMRLEISRKSWMFLTLPISVLVHLAVGNITPMTAGFFDIHGQYILKLVILILLVMGIKDIRIIRNANRSKKH